MAVPLPPVSVRIALVGARCGADASGAMGSRQARAHSVAIAVATRARPSLECTRADGVREWTRGLVGIGGEVSGGVRSRWRIHQR